MVASMIRARTEAGETMRRRLGVLLAKERQDFQILINFFLSSSNSFSWVGWEGETRAVPCRYPKYRSTLLPKLPLPNCPFGFAGSPGGRGRSCHSHKPTTPDHSRHGLSQVASPAGSFDLYLKTQFIPVRVCVCVPPCPGPSYPPFPPSPWSGHSRRALAAAILVTTTQLPVDIPTEFQHPASSISFPEPQDTLPPSPGHTPAYPPNISHLWVNELQQHWSIFHGTLSPSNV